MYMIFLKKTTAPIGSHSILYFFLNENPHYSKNYNHEFSRPMTNIVTHVKGSCTKHCRFGLPTAIIGVKAATPYRM